MENTLGIYLHIPFCRSKCQYCDFYSLAGWKGDARDYQRALLVHLRETAPSAAGRAVDSVYFGGGTPSLYGEKYLRELLEAVKRSYTLSKNPEITWEANPDSMEGKALRRLVKAGFNRLSLGMQSARDEELVAMGRPHTMADTRLAVRLARQAGIKNLSLDLIYGFPGQTADSWRETLWAALSLEPEHLSCYGLKVEPGTPLERRVAEGELPMDDDRQAELYLWTVAELDRAGYRQYEISNFAKPGMESRHNLRYWTLQPYIGFGPGAHSDFGNRRYSFLRDLDGYITGVLRGGHLLEEDELLPIRERGGEYLMLGLRTARGIEEEEYRNRFRQDFAPLAARLEEFHVRGWAEKTADARWRLTPEGFLLSNQLIGDLLARQTALQAVYPLPQARSGRG